MSGGPAVAGDRDPGDGPPGDTAPGAAAPGDSPSGMGTRARVEADREVCIGSGNCVASLPEVFDQDEDGLVVLRVTSVDADREAQLRRAVLRCPSGAIRLQPMAPAGPAAQAGPADPRAR